MVGLVNSLGGKANFSVSIEGTRNWMNFFVAVLGSNQSSVLPPEKHPTFRKWFQILSKIMQHIRIRRFPNWGKPQPQTNLTVSALTKESLRHAQLLSFYTKPSSSSLPHRQIEIDTEFCVRAQMWRCITNILNHSFLLPVWGNVLAHSLGKKKQKKKPSIKIDWMNTQLKSDRARIIPKHLSTQKISHVRDYSQNGIWGMG